MLYRAATSPNAAPAAISMIHQIKPYKTSPWYLPSKGQPTIPFHISSISQNNQTQPSIAQTFYASHTRPCQTSPNRIPTRARVTIRLSKSINHNNNILKQITNVILEKDNGLTRQICRYRLSSRGASLARSMMRSHQFPVQLTIKMTAKHLV